MSYKGTPWYDMAIDAGMRGDEAEQMARLLESQAQYEAEQQTAYEQQMVEDQAAQQEKKMRDYFNIGADLEMFEDNELVEVRADVLRAAQAKLEAMEREGKANEYALSQEADSFKRIVAVLAALEAKLEAMEQVQTAAQAHVNAVRYQLEIEDEPHTHRLLREALAAAQQEQEDE